MSAINELVSDERLDTIKSWRETYGQDANVMIPASEAEAIARELQQYRAAVGPTEQRDELPYAPQIAEYEKIMQQAIPDGYALVPSKLTAENGAKGALSGEFSETKFISCPECFGDDECETCDGSGRIEITVPVSWTSIKEIWAKGVEHFAAAPQQEAQEVKK
ncbi:hypothetical protein [Atlantibacter hermannii]|uniref:hypothetical protein n=1 Tax=Atlantibacter hermannii TaxID=565 RepID=UPI00289B60D0|nr:hypothetical protein [Atlantibacter hermannii]